MRIAAGARSARRCCSPGLRRPDFDRIHRPIDQLTYPPGADLYNQDDPAGSISDHPNGPSEADPFSPGWDAEDRAACSGTTDVVGLEAMVTPHYEHTATALHPTQVCRISVDTVKELARNQPKLCEDLMDRWHRALNDADRCITEFCTGPARSRVARLLIWLCERKQNQHCELFGREDLGAHCSASRRRRSAASWRS